jgi:hypothetical protein
VKPEVKQRDHDAILQMPDGTVVELQLGQILPPNIGASPFTADDGRTTLGNLADLALATIKKK